MPNLSAPALSQLPERENLKRAMRRRRRRDLPANPKSIEYLGVIPNRYTTTLVGERFLIYDSADDPDVSGRILVFSTRRNLEILARIPVWFLDGTFKVTFLVTFLM